MFVLIFGRFDLVFIFDWTFDDFRRYHAFSSYFSILFIDM